MRKPQYLLEKLNASFWFIPILMLGITIVSSMGFIYLDSQIQFSQDGTLQYLLNAAEKTFPEKCDVENIKDRFTSLQEAVSVTSNNNK